MHVIVPAGSGRHFIPYHLDLSIVHLTRQFTLCSARVYLELYLEASSALRDLNVARDYNKYSDPELSRSLL